MRAEGKKRFLHGWHFGITLAQHLQHTFKRKQRHSMDQRKDPGRCTSDLQTKTTKTFTNIDNRLRLTSIIPGFDTIKRTTGSASSMHSIWTKQPVPTKPKSTETMRLGREETFFQSEPERKREWKNQKHTPPQAVQGKKSPWSFKPLYFRTKHSTHRLLKQANLAFGQRKE